MQDLYTHGKVDSIPPQTFCGLVTFGRKVSSDHNQVNCKNCQAVMVKAGALPEPTVIEYEEPKKKKKGGK